jgi:hypothetical protein
MPAISHEATVANAPSGKFTLRAHQDIEIRKARCSWAVATGPDKGTPFTSGKPCEWPRTVRGSLWEGHKARVAPIACHQRP